MYKFKVGEKVVFKSCYITKIVTISKITPTGRLKLKESPGLSFDPDGRERGSDGFGRAYLTEYTDQLKSELYLRALRNKIKKFDYDNLDKKTLEKLKEILWKK